MNWKTSFRSISYEGAPEPDHIVLVPERTAMLAIDVQNTCLERPAPKICTAKSLRS